MSLCQVLRMYAETFRASSVSRKNRKVTFSVMVGQRFRRGCANNDGVQYLCLICAPKMDVGIIEARLS